MDTDAQKKKAVCAVSRRVKNSRAADPMIPTQPEDKTTTDTLKSKRGLRQAPGKRSAADAPPKKQGQHGSKHKGTAPTATESANVSPPPQLRWNLIDVNTGVSSCDLSSAHGAVDSNREDGVGYIYAPQEDGGKEIPEATIASKTKLRKPKETCAQDREPIDIPSKRTRFPAAKRKSNRKQSDVGNKPGSDSLFAPSCDSAAQSESHRDEETAAPAAGQKLLGTREIARDDRASGNIITDGAQTCMRSVPKQAKHATKPSFQSTGDCNSDGFFNDLGECEAASEDRGKEKNGFPKKKETQVFEDKATEDASCAHKKASPRASSSVENPTSPPAPQGRKRMSSDRTCEQLLKHSKRGGKNQRVAKPSPQNTAATIRSIQNLLATLDPTSLIAKEVSKALEKTASKRAKRDESESESGTESESENEDETDESSDEFEEEEEEEEEDSDGPEEESVTKSECDAQHSTQKSGGPKGGSNSPLQGSCADKGADNTSQSQDEVDGTRRGAWTDSNVSVENSGTAGDETGVEQPHGKATSGSESSDSYNKLVKLFATAAPNSRKKWTRRHPPKKRSIAGSKPTSPSKSKKKRGSTEVLESIDAHTSDNADSEKNNTARIKKAAPKAKQASSTMVPSLKQTLAPVLKVEVKAKQEEDRIKRDASKHDVATRSQAKAKARPALNPKVGKSTNPGTHDVATRSQAKSKARPALDPTVGKTNPRMKGSKAEAKASTMRPSAQSGSKNKRADNMNEGPRTLDQRAEEKSEKALKHWFSQNYVKAKPNAAKNTHEQDVAFEEFQQFVQSRKQAQSGRKTDTLEASGSVHLAKLSAPSGGAVETVPNAHQAQYCQSATTSTDLAKSQRVKKKKDMPGRAK